MLGRCSLLRKELRIILENKNATRKRALLCSLDLGFKRKLFNGKIRLALLTFQCQQDTEAVSALSDSSLSMKFCKHTTWEPSYLSCFVETTITIGIFLKLSWNTDKCMEVESILSTSGSWEYKTKSWENLLMGCIQKEMSCHMSRVGLLLSYIISISSL